MRTVLLALLHRRSGLSFQLKTARYEVIGTMTLNPKTSQHEMEISEADYLKHAKELARLCQQPTTAVYPLEFREKIDEQAVTKRAEDYIAARSEDHLGFPGVSGDAFAMGPEETMAGRVIPTFGKMDTPKAEYILADDLKGKPFFALRKIAQQLGIDTTSTKGNDALKAAIRTSRLANKILAHEQVA